MSWNSFQCEQSYSMRMEWRTDEQTDMTKLIVAFHNFANASKTKAQKIKGEKSRDLENLFSDISEYMSSVF